MASNASALASFDDTLTHFLNPQLLESGNSGGVVQQPASGGSAPTSTPGSSAPSSSLMSGITSAATQAISGIFTGLFSTRVVAIILGILVIIAALVLFGFDDLTSAATSIGRKAGVLE